MLVENDGYLFVSDEGRQQEVDRLAEAFPGADIRYCAGDPCVQLPPVAARVAG